MSHWFDARATKARPLSPEQRHKIRLITDALGKSDHDVSTYLKQILANQNAAVKFPDPQLGPGRLSPTSLDFFTKLSAELLRARDRLDALQTGLRAERELSGALTQSAAAVAAWHRGMGSDDGLTIDRAQAAAHRLFVGADKLAKAGVADLKRGR
jgi:hypothetical protein